MMPKRITNNKQPKGMVMLLALLVLSAITAVAVGMSAIVIKNLRASSNNDRSMLAYYAAETGIEAGLSRIKAARVLGTEPLSDVISDLVAMEGGGGAGNARWSLENSATNEDYTLTYLRMNETVVLDLYDPTAPGFGAGFESFFVEALDADPTKDPAWLEISYFPWQTDGGNAYWLDTQVTKRLRSVYETQPTMAAGFGPLDPNNNYRIRVKALYDNLKNVRIVGYNVDSPFGFDAGSCDPITLCQKNIPNRILLRSTGSLGSNLVALSASVPWQVPTSALFDYVLFSEESIDKRT